MSRISLSVLKNWLDGDIVKAVDYKKEREILAVAINDNYDRILDRYTKFEVDSFITIKNSEISALQGRSTSLEGRATSLEGRATKNETDITSLKGRATNVESRSTSLEGRATTLEGRATKLENDKANKSDTFTRDKLYTKDELYTKYVLYTKGEINSFLTLPNIVNVDGGSFLDQHDLTTSVIDGGTF